MQESDEEDGGNKHSSDSDGDVRRSAISGKKIKMKLDRTREQKELDKKRKSLLEFLNQTM